MLAALLCLGFAVAPLAKAATSRHSRFSSDSPFKSCESQQWREGYSQAVLECFIKATDLYPDHIGSSYAYLAIAQNYHYQHNASKTKYYLDILNRIYQQSPVQAGAALLRARISIGANRFDEALSLLSQANERSLFPDEVREYFHLQIEVHKRRGDRTKQVSTLVTMLDRPELVAELQQTRDSLRKLFPEMPHAELMLLRSKATGEQGKMELAHALLMQDIQKHGAGKQQEQIAAFLKDFPKSRHRDDLEKLRPKAIQSAAKPLAATQEELPQSPFFQHVVGVILPLSGTFATYGQQAKRGIDLALTEINAAGGPKATPFTVVYKDTQEDAAKLETTMTELVKQQQASIILGPMRQDAVNKAAHVSMQLGVPLLPLSQDSNAATLASTVVFHGFSKELQAESLVAHCAETLGITRFAILYPTHAYGMDFAQHFWNAVARHQGEIVAAESYSPKEKNFKKRLMRLVGTDEPASRQSEQCTQDKLQSGAPCISNWQNPPPVLDFQALFIPDNILSASYIIPTLFFNDYAGFQILGTNAWNQPELTQRIDAKVLQGVTFPDLFWLNSSSEVTKKFIQAYRAANNNQDPTLVAALAYDVARTSLLALSARAYEKRNDFFAEIDKLRNVSGATGEIERFEQRVAKRKLTLFSVDEGQIKELY